MLKMSATDGPFAASRRRYVEPWTSGVLCVGSKAGCQHLTDRGAERIDWDARPSEEVAARTLRLYLLPTPAQVTKSGGRVPEYVPELPALEFLRLPFAMFASLRGEDLPSSVRCIMVPHEAEYVKTERIISRPEGPSFPGVRGLVFFGDAGPATEWSRLGLTASEFPALRFLDTEVDKEGRVLSALATFPGLEHAELSHVFSHRVFGSLPAKTMRVLRVTNSSPTWSLPGVEAFDGLESLSLLAIKAPVDCRLLVGLPNLAELVIKDSKKLANVASLLECRRLARLTIVNCGGAVSSSLSSKLAGRRFEVLNTDHA